jgi:peroxiredoxin
VNRGADRILVALIVVLAGALAWVVYPTLEQRVIGAGDNAPEFRVTTDHGRTISRSNFGGKILVLNFWASWCPPCITELPSLEAFHHEFASQGVVVLGVSIDRNENLYRRFIERRKVTFETVRDPEADISASYGTFQIPETYIIDRSGKVVEKVISDQNWMDPDFLARMRKLL